MSTSVTMSGIRAGRVTAFCAAMGWEVRPYQTIAMERMVSRAKYKAFIPVAPPKTFDQIWEEWHPRKKGGWVAITFEETAFLTEAK